MRTLSILLLIMLMWASVEYSRAETGLSYTPGGGMSLTVDDARLRLLGYIQPTYTVHTVNRNNALSNEFFVRRARLDFIFDYKDQYQLFVELDARGSRTEMVLAQADVRYATSHWLRVGKFITPFSPENNRSSRSLTTIERYTALNSIFLEPGLDTQYGIMFHGRLSDWAYWLSVTNGNGKASQNIRENNSEKDVQLRLDYQVSKNLSIGASGNYTVEASQMLRLVDHTFTSFAEAFTTGKRVGYLADFEYTTGPWLLRAEALQYHYLNELQNSVNEVERFYGGYSELGYFLTGDGKHGYQLIGRIETANFSDVVTELEVGPTSIVSFILGHNWYRHGVFRHQINLIYERANRDSAINGNRFTGRSDAFEILSMLQIKF